MYRLTASGIYQKLVDDMLNAPAEIPLPKIHMNEEYNSVINFEIEIRVKLLLDSLASFFSDICQFKI
jgi:hypothetical protein